MPFSVGDKVRIRPDSKFYGQQNSNPTDEVGTITNIDVRRTLGIRVQWVTCHNFYREEDLKLAVPSIPEIDPPVIDTLVAF